MKKPLLFLAIIFICDATHAQQVTFTNPLLPVGADPWSIYKDEYYYYTHTVSDSIVLWKTKDLAELDNAERKTIYVPPKDSAYSRHLWAPEIHYIDQKWYIYFAADNGRNETHRIYVLENESQDPFSDEWHLKAKVSDTSDKWAIDPSIFRYRKTLYMVWSGWEGDKNGRQDIYIAKMKNPWTMVGERVRISSPVLYWEKHGALYDSLNPPLVTVNEGPQILMRKKKLFLVYSANGCWTEQYCLGLLTFTGKKNLLDSALWNKSAKPLFEGEPKNGVYAPGHNSFFKSPNGKEDWLLYHANSAPGQGCGKNRSPRAQQFYWSKEGNPYLGKPVKTGVPIKAPAKENK